jgi:hypothetical protein
LDFFGRPDIGAGAMAFTSGMRVIGDRTWDFMAASFMVSDMTGSDSKAGTGEAASFITTAA